MSGRFGQLDGTVRRFKVEFALLNLEEFYKKQW